MSAVNIFTYLFIVNVVAFYLYGSDKRRAVYGHSRVPEALLLFIAMAGGAYGALTGMWLFRHKTRHRSFTITVPVCLFIWSVAVMLGWLSFQNII